MSGREQALLRAAILALALLPAPAAACSISWREPRDPAVRYAGTDVRRVTGTYRIQGVGPVRGPDDPALLHGRLTTRRGTGYDVAQAYSAFLVECAAYDLPQGDAEGLFYLSRRASDGRYRLLGWTGRHIPGRVIQPGDGSGEEGQH